MIPRKGTELCAVVEAMFSLETDIAILGDPALGDRLEKIAYNALPGTLTADLWGHQYDQQANQVMVQRGQPPLGDQRSRFEPLWSRAEFRLLHRQHASRVAQVRRQFVDGDARMAVSRRSLMAPAKCPRALPMACPSALRRRRIIPSGKP